MSSHDRRQFASSIKSANTFIFAATTAKVEDHSEFFLAGSLTSAKVTVTSRLLKNSDAGGNQSAIRIRGTRISVFIARAEGSDRRQAWPVNTARWRF